MIAHHYGNDTAQLSRLVALQNIHQAMQMLRDKYGHARSLVHQLELPIHLEFGRENLELLAKLLDVESVQRPLDAHKKEPSIVILMLVGVNDVRSVTVQKASDPGDEALAVRAGDQHDGGVFHFVANCPTS